MKRRLTVDHAGELLQPTSTAAKCEPRLRRGVIRPDPERFGRCLDGVDQDVPATTIGPMRSRAARFQQIRDPVAEAFTRHGRRHVMGFVFDRGKQLHLARRVGLMTARLPGWQTRSAVLAGERSHYLSFSSILLPGHPHQEAAGDTVAGRSLTSIHRFADGVVGVGSTKKAS